MAEEACPGCSSHKAKRIQERREGDALPGHGPRDPHLPTMLHLPSHSYPSGTISKAPAMSTDVLGDI